MITTATYTSGNHLHPRDLVTKAIAEVELILVEDELKKYGGSYSNRPDWQSNSVCDDNMITVQNPAASEAVAKAVLTQLR